MNVERILILVLLGCSLWLLNANRQLQSDLTKINNSLSRDIYYLNEQLNELRYRVNTSVLWELKDE